MTKTTLEFPEKTLRRAKARAAEEGIPLRQFVTEAVEARLTEKTGDSAKPWMKMFGGLKHLHQENIRIQKIIDEEFENIDPEDWD